MKKLLIVSVLILINLLPSCSQIDDELKKNYVNIAEANVEIERSVNSLGYMITEKQTNILGACYKNENKNKDEINLTYSYMSEVDSLMSLIINLKKELCILTQGKEVSSYEYQFLLKVPETNKYLIDLGNAKKLETRLAKYYIHSKSLVEGEEIKRSIDFIMDLNPIDGIDWYKYNFDNKPFIMAIFRLSLIQFKIREIQWTVLTYRLSNLDL